MTTKEQILQEMEAVPEPILSEVLDFLKFLKAGRTQLEKHVTVVSSVGESSVSLSALAAQEPRIAEQLIAAPMPISQICSELRQALDRSGYSSHEQIIDLVQDVKQEMFLEREERQGNRA